MNEMFFDVANFVIASILAGIGITWISLLRSMKDTFDNSPHLDEFDTMQNKGESADATNPNPASKADVDKSASPMVSVIIPARNEQEYIKRSLQSLMDQDYQNYEVIAIDDGSEDNTAMIIEELANRNKDKLVHIKAREKPDGWMGKNWACFEGYKKAKGELLLFTDADTWHSPKVISLAVRYMQSGRLDALSAIPKILCKDFWTKITLTMLSSFLHTRFSPSRVNDPEKKTGYFMGSFFIMQRRAYEEIGTHKGVRSEIIEDGALGKKTKEGGYKMKMVRADHLIEAIWARDLTTLWNGLKRLIIPLYIQSKMITLGIFTALVFLLFFPIPTLGVSLVFSDFIGGIATMPFSLAYSSTFAVAFFALFSTITLYAAAFYEARCALGIPARYAVFAPLGSLVIILGFASGISKSKEESSVMWRGRSYSLARNMQDSINI